MQLWYPTPQEIWQGRNDLHEAPNALRLFQTIECRQSFDLTNCDGKIGLLGFESDEGVERNHGRIGAAQGPNVIRQALANLASHANHYPLVDLGNIRIQDRQLEEAHTNLSNAIKACQQNKLRTLVLGGGHETAFGHGLGIYHAYPNDKITIINFDAHLDLRTANRPTSGTPFKQLSQYCQVANRVFSYYCIGANPAANTQALLDTAYHLDSRIIWDTQCNEDNLSYLIKQITEAIESTDKIYMTIDLDVLPEREMPAVSAPAALGVPMATLLKLIRPICQSSKLYAADLVEFSPPFDHNQQGARVAARLTWQILHWWQ